MESSRQLAAIMFTDIVGYSALMGADEDGAMELLNKSIQIQKALVHKHRGKWVKEVGDGVIILFDSVLDAVICAREIQRAVRNEKNLFLKIAIHSGELIVRERDVLGDGVNLTARLEQLAGKNSVLLSGSAVSNIKSIKSIKTCTLGTFNFKNIAAPVTVFALVAEGLSIPDLSDHPLQAQSGHQASEEMASRDEAFMNRVLNMIDSNMANRKLSVSFLSRELGVSRPQLYRKLTRNTGFSPSNFIREARLRRAAALLHSGDGNVSEAAYTVGFDNLSYFSKCFHERFGCTPSEYLKKNRRIAGIPRSLDRFIGRHIEIKEIVKILDGTRLLTITGTGGTGKSRLASEIQIRYGHTYRHGAYFVELAPVQIAEDVIPKIAQILRISQDPTKETLVSLIQFIRDQEFLLILDNFEHVLGATERIRDLLLACVNLTIIVTSRVVLNVSGEIEYSLSQLGLPERQKEHTVKELTVFPSVELFINRTQAVRPDFALTEDNKAHVSALCRRLDGLPLALELAAARMKLFSPQALLKRLSSKLDILSTTQIAQPDRHRTLTNAIGWSYDLLAPAEQTIFRRLSVFSGGCTLEAAEAVCFQGYANLDVVDQISGLVDKSLLQREDQKDGEPRFYMLETIKAFGRERLKHSLEMEKVMLVYAHFYKDMVEEAQVHLTGPEQGRWCDIIEIELDNLRSILSWMEQREDSETGLKIALSFWRYWNVRAMMREGSQWLRRVLEIPMRNKNTTIRCRALNAYGILFGTTRKIPDAISIFEESLEIAKRLHYEEGIGEALNHLAWTEHYQQNHRRSESYSHTALEIYRKLGIKRGISVSYGNLGWAQLVRGKLPKSLNHFNEAASIRNLIGDVRGYAYNLTNAGWTLAHMGDYEASLANLKTAERTLEQIEDRQLLAWVTNIKALTLLYSGSWEEAGVIAKRGLPLWEGSGNLIGKVHCLLLQLDISLVTEDEELGQHLVQRLNDDEIEGIQGHNSPIYNYLKSRLELETLDNVSSYKAVKTHLEDIINRDTLLFLTDFLELIAHLLVNLGRQRDALVIFAASSKFRERRKIPAPTVRRTFRDEIVSRLRLHFNPCAFEKYWADGQVTSHEECWSLIQSIDV